MKTQQNILIGFCLLGGWILGCARLDSSTTQPPPMISTEVLAEIEASLIPEYRQEPARFDGLYDYFRDANPDLFAHLDQVQADYAAGEAQRGITYIAGSSGVGKSYVIYKLGLPKDATKTIKLTECFDQQMPDLATADGEVVFNRLSGAKTINIKSLIETQDAVGKSFVLFDDLDEIHPDTAQLFLQALEAYVGKTENQFLHVLVFGRPESFWPWLQDSQRSPPPHVEITVHPLFGPDYQTIGDIAYRCQNYHEFRKSSPAPERFIQAVQARLEVSPYLRYTIRPLSAGNLVLDEYLNQDLKSSEEERRQDLFKSLLVRNTKSHGRPGVESSQYMTLLYQAALHPLEHKTIEEDGFFCLQVEDMICFVDEQGNAQKVSACDVLDRSGLVLLDIKEKGSKRYRFEPFWIHEYLVNELQLD